MVFLSNGLWKRNINPKERLLLSLKTWAFLKKFFCPLLISIRCHMEKFWDSFLVADDESYASKDVIPFFFISLLSLLYHPILSFSFTKFLLHAIKRKSLTTSQTAKNTRRRNGEKKKEIMLWGRRRVWGLLVLFSMFLDAWELRFPPLFPGISECQKGPQDTFPSPLIQSDVKSVTICSIPLLK